MKDFLWLCTYAIQVANSLLSKRQISRRDKTKSFNFRFFPWRGTFGHGSHNQIGNFGIIGSSYLRYSRSLHLFFSIWFITDIRCLRYQIYGIVNNFKKKCKRVAARRFSTKFEFWNTSLATNLMTRLTAMSSFQCWQFCWFLLLSVMPNTSIWFLLHLDLQILI